MNEYQVFELALIDREIECTFQRRLREQQAQIHLAMANEDEGVEEIRAQPMLNAAKGVVNEAAYSLNDANAIIMAGDRERAIREYAAPMFNELNPSIVRPKIQAAQFELKHVMFQMLQTMGQFSGLPTEDPHLHLRSFLEVSDSFKLQGVTEEALRLKLFPFSLKDKARAWLNTFPSNSVTTWHEVAEKFLMKYFPPTKNAKFQNEIISFQQLEDESICDAWERFKELLRKCPHHGIPHCIQMETFYNGLNASTRMVLDASTNGVILSKSCNEPYEILEQIANNNYQWSSARAPIGRKVVGMHEVDSLKL
ncbi:uncharacterized protein LOC133800570 [Humulus lupulus]|uniref:uncharacterized protein LOC133800570 n=1 Tax=Humulus lupulus TaxID=3486 RepID=UPI002B412A02|nr:uncharacterized protein LOC133800570 [Humulus lupulus]